MMDTSLMANRRWNRPNGCEDIAYEVIALAAECSLAPYTAERTPLEEEALQQYLQHMSDAVEQAVLQ
jgi:hypothetical protein